MSCTRAASALKPPFLSFSIIPSMKMGNSLVPVDFGHELDRKRLAKIDITKSGSFSDVHAQERALINRSVTLRQNLFGTAGYRRQSSSLKFRATYVDYLIDPETGLHPDIDGNSHPRQSLHRKREL